MLGNSMIDKKNKIIFVHITKTAGISIEKYFNQPRQDHRTSIDYISLLGKDEYRKYFSFTIVRNPWDKMVSQYFYNAHKFVPKGTSFKEYIQLFAQGYKITTHSPFHFSYIYDSNNNLAVDYIGRFEDLDKSMEYICNTIGIKYDKLPHENKSKHKKYEKYYDEESRELVYKIFKAEINYFGYTFANP